jgi:hypothetical protein
MTLSPNVRFRTKADIRCQLKFVMVKYTFQTCLDVGLAFKIEPFIQGVAHPPEQRNPPFCPPRIEKRSLPL